MKIKWSSNSSDPEVQQAVCRNGELWLPNNSRNRGFIIHEVTHHVLDGWGIKTNDTGHGSHFAFMLCMLAGKFMSVDMRDRLMLHFEHLEVEMKEPEGTQWKNAKTILTG